MNFYSLPRTVLSTFNSWPCFSWKHCELFLSTASMSIVNYTRFLFMITYFDQSNSFSCFHEFYLHCTYLISMYIAGFHCHSIIKTIRQIKSRIREVKEDEYSNSLAKICATFRAGDIRRKCFTQICKAMHGDSRFESLWRTQMWRLKAETHVI